MTKTLLVCSSLPHGYHSNGRGGAVYIYRTKVATARSPPLPRKSCLLKLQERREEGTKRLLVAPARSLVRRRLIKPQMHSAVERNVATCMHDLDGSEPLRARIPRRRAKRRAGRLTSGLHAEPGPDGRRMQDAGRDDRLSPSNRC